MAKVNPGDEPMKRSDVLRARRLIHFKPLGPDIVAQKWPRPRGTPKSDVQRAWVQRFSLLACMLKVPERISFETAQQQSAGTGWFWRDELTAAASGNLIRNGDAPRVTTPTVYVRRNASLTLSAGAITPVPWDTLVWDNNVFWAASPNPTRLVCRSSGLYMFGAGCNFTLPTATGGRTLRPLFNGATVLGGQAVTATNNVVPTLSTAWIYYFNEGEYMELTVISAQALPLTFAHMWLVAITPEGIIP